LLVSIFDVIGDGFSTNPADDAVLVDGQGDIIADRGTSAEGCKNKKLPCLRVENPQKLHVIGYQGEKIRAPSTWA